MFVISCGTRNRVDWRILVKECIAKLAKLTTPFLTRAAPKTKKRQVVTASCFQINSGNDCVNYKAGYDTEPVNLMAQDDKNEDMEKKVQELVKGMR